MMRLYRPNAPQFLVENWEEWGKEYADKRAANPAFTFQWRQIEQKKVNLILEELLSETMTQYHCSYCDGGRILGAASRATIDHFRPKSQFPSLVYEWGNLFVCCDGCQQVKLEQFEEVLLKPDAEDFSTIKYFLCNYETGEIEINPTASLQDQARAKATIRLFGLNTIRRCKMRLSEWRKWDKTNPSERLLDEWNYRFFLEP